MEEKFAGVKVGSESFVAFQDEHESEIHGLVRRLAHFQVVFEVYGPLTSLRVSEVLKNFKVLLAGRSAYSGSAVIESLVSAGSVTICEASLEKGWSDFASTAFADGPAGLNAGFSSLIRRWQDFYQVRTDFKLLLTDMQSFMMDMESWLEQIELGVRAIPEKEQSEALNRAARDLEKAAAPTLDDLFERFESATMNVEPELSAAYRALCRRQLHRFFMSCPFMHRIYSKPLGYAGDYEMMNMIWRNEADGGSLFGKLLSVYILNQAPARSVRNRVAHMTQRITEETLRVTTLGRSARIYSLGCGPAREVENFLPHSLADRASFEFMDFDDETLAYTGARMEKIRKANNRSTRFNLVKKSVYYLLKESGKQARATGQFDLIYSSGLYDYLNDRVSRTVNTYLFDQLAPGGVLIISNFDPSNPIRNLMEYAFEWFLIHRNSRQLQATGPDQVPPEACMVRADPTGCNIFMEVRKPMNAA